MDRGSPIPGLAYLGAAPEPLWVDTQPNQIKALTAIRWETRGGSPTFSLYDLGNTNQ